MSEILVLSEFKDNLIEFFDDLIDQLPKEGVLVMLRLFLVNNVPVKDIMDHFNHNINKDSQLLRTMVKHRNESFFMENDPFGFAGHVKDSANHLKGVWRSPDLDDDDKTMIWSWVDAFIAIGDKYTKCVADREKSEKDAQFKDTS
jgi:hypothetical protein